MVSSFYEYLKRVNEQGPPPPTPAGGANPPGGGSAPPGGGTPPPGGDPMAGGMGGGGMGGGAGSPPPPGGDPSGAPSAPRKPINITTVWDAIRSGLGNDAERTEPDFKSQPPKPANTSSNKMSKSLIQ